MALEADFPAERGRFPGWRGRASRGSGSALGGGRSSVAGPLLPSEFVCYALVSYDHDWQTYPTEISGFRPMVEGEKYASPFFARQILSGGTR